MRAPAASSAAITPSPSGPRRAWSSSSAARSQAYGIQGDPWAFVRDCVWTRDEATGHGAPLSRARAYAELLVRRWQSEPLLAVAKSPAHGRDVALRRLQLLARALLADGQGRLHGPEARQDGDGGVGRARAAGVLHSPPPAAHPAAVRGRVSRLAFSGFRTARRSWRSARARSRRGSTRSPASWPTRWPSGSRRTRRGSPCGRRSRAAGALRPSAPRPRDFSVTWSTISWAKFSAVVTVPVEVEILDAEPEVVGVLGIAPTLHPAPASVGDDRRLARRRPADRRRAGAAGDGSSCSRPRRSSGCRTPSTRPCCPRWALPARVDCRSRGRVVTARP